jgi:hypothetical protein
MGFGGNGAVVSPWLVPIFWVFSRDAYQFGFFGWYLVGISQFLPNQYRRKTWSVHFGIIFLAGTPFFLKRGVMAQFFRGSTPILRKKGFPAKP